MSKRQMIVFLSIFNVLMIVAFIFSNIYIWDYLNTQINLQSSHQPNGATILPSIQINGLQVTVSHAGWTSDGMLIPMPAPISVPNYPFFIFWVAIVGNLILMALILRKRKHAEKQL